MIGTLRNVDELGTVQNFGSMRYMNARYMDDNGIEQDGLSLSAVSWTLSCFGGLWRILDKSGDSQVLYGGSCSCIIASVTPDKDKIGNQLLTGTLTYTNLVIFPPFIKFPSQPLVAWISALNTFGWAKPFAGGG
jgi:hypothetical protein